MKDRSRPSKVQTAESALNLRLQGLGSSSLHALTKHSGQGLKLVVADDSAVYRKLVQDTLESEGYSVVLATSGREARKAIIEARPSVLITDWEMPDATGIELCREIRECEEMYTYIIILTAKSEKDKIIEGLAAGADDYLTKPFHPGELLARVAVGRRISELHRKIQASNNLLEQLSLTDSLTGLPNRRAVEAWASREMAGAVRHGFSFWLVMADLDHFKRINDTHGHEAGDAVLRNFADLLKANTRASNMCGRFGGEEFLIALSHTGKAGVQTAIERIRTKFETQEHLFAGSRIHATASFGIAGLQPRASTFDKLLREADAALYRAKHQGRNRVEFVGEPPMEP
jgi:two-component system cell cycle response regulator